MFEFIPNNKVTIQCWVFIKQIYNLLCIFILQVEHPEYYSNMDLENIETPIKVEVLENLLVTSGYPTDRTKFLIKGFSEGFELGY